jgi:hypothetical protein
VLSGRPRGPLRLRGVGAHGGSAPTTCPAGWREGLRSFEWHICDAGTLAWVEQLRGLTSLDLHTVSMTPAFFRCAPLGMFLFYLLDFWKYAPRLQTLGRITFLDTWPEE